MEDYFEILKNTSIFKGIERNEMREMLSCLGARKEKYKKDDFVLWEGSTVKSLGLLLTGEILVIQEDFWGNRNIIAVLGRGQCFGETFACAPGSVLNISVIARENAEVLFLNVQQLMMTGAACSAHYNLLIRNLLTDLAEKNLRLNEKVSHLSQRTTRAKLLSYLSAEAKKHGAATFSIPFSRQQLADFLSVERSGLSVELGKMQRDGLLEYHQNKFALQRQIYELNDPDEG